VHLSPLDFFLLGLVAFAAWRMFNRRRPGGRPPQDRPGSMPRPGTPDSGPAGPADPADEDEEARRRQASEAYRRAQASWDHLRSDSRPQAGQAAPQGQAAGPRVAQDDTAAFLEGAKAIYARIRESWGDRDLDDMANFLTERGLAEFRNKAESETPAGRTDVMLVEAEILDMGQEQARVRYTALIREANVGDAPRQVREDWTFLRPGGDPDAMWKLDAVAQPAD